VVEKPGQACCRGLAMAPSKGHKTIAKLRLTLPPGGYRTSETPSEPVLTSKYAKCEGRMRHILCFKAHEGSQLRSSHPFFRLLSFLSATTVCVAAGGRTKLSVSLQ
jgi:hypothetical protein